MDIGIGMKLDENFQVEPSSAFNSSLSGLDILGYGTDADGDPRNLVNLITSLIVYAGHIRSEVLTCSNLVVESLGCILNGLLCCSAVVGNNVEAGRAISTKQISYLSGLEVTPSEDVNNVSHILQLT